MTMTKVLPALAALGLLLAPAIADAQTRGSATGGSAGSAAAGGTSASTVGTGGTSTGSDGATGSLARHRWQRRRRQDQGSLAREPDR